MPRIYFPDLSHPCKIISLPPKQAQHVRVLRLQAGEKITLFDGKGHICEANPCKIDKKTVDVQCAKIIKVPQPKTFPIHLAMSLINREQMDWVIQKAVELGVTEITPIIATRTQGRLNAEQTEKRLIHWHEIMIAAAEQSGLNFLPKLNPPCTFDAFCKADLCDLKLILDPTASISIQSLQNSAQQAMLLIGPEGGFTLDEMTQAQDVGFMGVRLHEQVLRAETAAVSAIAIAQFCFALK